MSKVNKILEDNCINNYFLNVDEYSVNKKCFDSTSKKLNILQYNVRSMNRIEKFDDVVIFSKRLKEDIDIMVLGETWVQSINITSFQLNNFQGIFSCRDDRIGGGLTVFVRNNLKFNVLKCDDGHFPFHFICFELPDYNSTKLWAFYRPPKSDVELFLSFLDSIDVNKTDIIMVGDMNIPVNKSLDVALDYKNILMSSGMIVTNTFATRSISNNILDHVVCSFSNISTVHNSTIFSDISDHNFIYSTIVYKTKFFRHKLEHKITDFGKVDAYFDDFLTTTNFDTAGADPETTINLIIEKYNYLIEKFTVVKSVIAKLKNNNCCPWMTYNLWKLIGKRNKILKKFKLNNNLETRNQLYAINKKISSEKYFAKKRYYENMFSNVSQKNLWKNINQFLNRNTSKSNIETIEVNGDKYNNTLDIVNLFNDYFVNIGNSLGETIGSDRNINKFNTLHSNPDSMFLSSTTPAEVYNIICLLSSSKGGGPDNIRNLVLKRNAALFSEILAKLVNQIFETGVYPNILKIAKVVPVFKSGDKSLISNYRPISTLSVFDKIIEKVINTRLRNFLNRSNFFYAHQYGFREGAGTEMALVEMANLIYNAFDRKEYVGALFLDLKKAFDTVDHKLLLDKLYCYGFRGISYKLIKSYLSNRQQYVMIDKISSNVLNVNCGVPQGSVLGPLLFLIFINDISKLPLIGHINIFADDTAVIYETKDPSNIIINMEHDMEILLEYFKSNMISLNLSKTKFMTFHSPHKIPFNVPSFIINDIVVERVENFKYLGVTFDSRMSWDEHIKTIRCKMAPLVGLVRRISYYVPKYVLRLMYFAFIHPRILYGIIVYGTASSSKLKKLQILQNKSLKAISKLPSRFPSLSLFQTISRGILPVGALHDYQVSIYMYKALNVSSVLSNLVFCQNNHNYDTRFVNNLSCGFITNEFGRKSIRFSGPSEYNKLPEFIKNSVNIHHFKKNLKLYYLSLINNYIS